MSATSLVTKAWEIEGEADEFAEQIHKDVDRFLPGIRIHGIDILWAAFQHAGKTRAGIIVPPSFQKESGIQGMVGLILKVGPEIGTRPELLEHFAGDLPKVGDWAVIDTRYGIKFIMGGGGGREGRHIRIIESKLIYALIARPDWII
jgi:hypothetical protein